MELFVILFFFGLIAVIVLEPVVCWLLDRMNGLMEWLIKRQKAD